MLPLAAFARTVWLHGVFVVNASLTPTPEFHLQLPDGKWNWISGSALSKQYLWCRDVLDFQDSALTNLVCLFKLAAPEKAFGEISHNVWEYPVKPGSQKRTK